MIFFTPSCVQNYCRAITVEVFPSQCNGTPNHSIQHSTLKTTPPRSLPSYAAVGLQTAIQGELCKPFHNHRHIRIQPAQPGLARGIYKTLRVKLDSGSGSHTPAQGFQILGKEGINPDCPLKSLLGPWFIKLSETPPSHALGGSISLTLPHSGIHLTQAALFDLQRNPALLGQRGLESPSQRSGAEVTTAWSAAGPGQS